MIKKLFLTTILSVGICLSVSAANMNELPYKNIKEGQSLTYSEDGIWKIADKKATNYFTKKISDGTSNFSEFYTPDGRFLFSTGCNYEFIYNGNLIGYSNSELKFYEFTMDNDILQQRELAQDEIESLFKDFKTVKISEFATSTNSLRLKKDKKHYKIMLLNDTDRYFYHYGFTSNNAKFNIYPLRGFIDITKKGMIQFSHFGDNTKENPWFILLVR
ncbi:MAG: hypothetical protein NC408_08690 [Candidatus Gastranaerophilales bacterium]|nr:hypothetical protein [Candidatus Gastranaerophilales bacterium]MCM1073397.1 hypothetical protein [Bacteroides sp.]